MTLGANLAKARGNIVIILALITASTLVVAIERSELGRRPPVGTVRVAARAPTPGEWEAATFAWASLQRTAPDRARALEGRAAAFGLQVGATPSELSPAAAEAILLAVSSPSR